MPCLSCCKISITLPKSSQCTKSWQHCQLAVTDMHCEHTFPYQRLSLLTDITAHQDICPHVAQAGYSMVSVEPSAVSHLGFALAQLWHDRQIKCG